MEFVRLLTENAIKRENVNNAFISTASAYSQSLYCMLKLICGFYGFHLFAKANVTFWYFVKHLEIIKI